MRKTIGNILAVAITTGLCYGCASSDSAVDSPGVLVESPVTDETESGAQDPMDTDTDMTAEDTTNDIVSASNTPGGNLNILALAQQNPNLSTFVELVRAADLVVILESPAPYTVFVPTNAAFAALPSGTLEDLKDPSNKMELTRLLQAHVLPNRVSTSEMKNNMPMRTAQGDEVIVTRNGSEIWVGGARILTPDVQASNGLVNVVDKVLVPPQGSNR